MVEAMLDLVREETERIDSRFLEPACGSGNFLVQVLCRKRAAVELRFGGSDFEKRHYALLGLMCIYGIELLDDNIAECRDNLLDLFADYLGLDDTPLAQAWADGNDGADIWADPDVRFLDPFTKSGVFPREITSRLTAGLADAIPDLQERVDHILTKQVFGIAITHLTSLLARRSLYCSKWADGPHSVARSFGDPDGNIWFERIEHTWVGGTDKVLTADEDGNPIEKTRDGRCKYCGASQRNLDRDAGFETHAYAFIHTDDIKARVAELFGADMQFDVIIGNPPYQLDDGGFGSSAAPI